ncbi:hypothetical protein B0H14DRAFT_2944827 [Mycena olivaceomarginata]|nr:hypothetical protein B0H14DRAFT_2944827 [Mycena olivaceomarginata]
MKGCCAEMLLSTCICRMRRRRYMEQTRAANKITATMDAAIAAITPGFCKSGVVWESAIAPWDAIWLWLEALCEIEMEGRLMVEKDGEMDWGGVVGEVVGILEDELGERDKGDKEGEGVWEEARCEIGDDDVELGEGDAADELCLLNVFRRDWDAMRTG